MQQRYADDSDELEEWVRLEDLTDEDIAYNVTRLRREAQELFDHAARLEAWGAARRKGG